MNLKKLRQARADNDAAQANLRVELNELLGIDRDARTDEQKARIKAIGVEAARLAAEAKDIADELATAERLQAEELHTDAPAKPVVIMGHDRAEDAPITFGQFMQGVAFSAIPRELWGSYTMSPAIKAAVSGASSGTTADGGVFVRNEWNTSLMNRARQESQLLQRCDQITVGDGFDGVELPYVNETSRATGSRWGGVQVYRAAEAASVTATKPTFGKFELRLEEAKGLMYATDRVLRDASVLESVVNTAFPSEFAFKLDDEILRGTGTGQCLGLLNADCTVQQAKENGQTADTIKAENVIKMHARLLARNMGRAEWFINQECLPQLQVMSVAVGTAGGQLVYMPPGGLTQAPYGTLLGRPVNVIEVASGLGDVGDIFLADFSEYLVISKAMSSASSMHVRFIFDEMTFRWTWPIIGKPKLASAITPYKATSSTTLSPFVTLQAR